MPAPEFMEREEARQHTGSEREAMAEKRRERHSGRKRKTVDLVGNATQERAESNSVDMELAQKRKDDYADTAASQTSRSAPPTSVTRMHARSSRILATGYHLHWHRGLTNASEI